MFKKCDESMHKLSLGDLIAVSFDRVKYTYIYLGMCPFKDAFPEHNHYGARDGGPIIHLLVLAHHFDKLRYTHNIDDYTIISRTE